MSLVAAKCTQCGSNLEVDSSHEAALCPHCKTPFVIKSAINNYNTYHQFQIQHTNVRINDGNSIQNRIKNAEVFLTKHKDYKKAEELFRGISEDAPDDYRIWWGILRSQTREFSNWTTYILMGDLYQDHHNSSESDLDSYIQSRVFDRDFYHKAIAVAPDDVIEQLKNTWIDYGNRAAANARDYIKTKEELKHLEPEKKKQERYIENVESLLKSRTLYSCTPWYCSWLASVSRRWLRSVHFRL